MKRVRKRLSVSSDLMPKPLPKHPAGWATV
jgi:hypothetical protein